MKDQPKETEIPGSTEDMILAVVAGARLAVEQTPFDEWLYDVFHCEPGMPIRRDFAASEESARPE